MLAAVKGIVQGNTVVIEDEDIRDYNGTEVIVTLLNSPQRKAKKAPVDWDSFVIPNRTRLVLKLTIGTTHIKTSF